MPAKLYGVAAIWLLFPGVVTAQAPAEPGPPIQYAVTFTVGSLWPMALPPATDSTTLPMLGLRVAGYPWVKGWVRLASLDIQAAYGGDERDFVGAELDGRQRFNGHLIEVAPGAGLDLVQTPRFGLRVRAGWAALWERQTYSLERTEPDENFNTFENVCHLKAFTSRCSENFAGSGFGGVEVRILRKQGGALFFGAGSTRLNRGRQRISGTIGLLARRKPTRASVP